MRAGTNMVEHTKPYAGVTLITASHFFGLSFHVAGDITTILSDSDNNVNDRARIEIDQTETFYQKIKYAESGFVKAFILIGHTQNLSHFKRSLLTQTPL